MADRLTLIMELGAVATEAALRGDDRAAATCREAAALLFEDKSSVDKIERRRKKDRESRPVEHPRIPRDGPNLPKSSESAEIVGGSQGFPTPLPNSPTQQHNTPRERIVESQLDDLTKLTFGQVREAMGALFCDAEDFLLRRDSSTWHAWLKEMLVALRAYTVEDVASVCRDDGALERRIGSPGGFRVFMRTAAEERVGLGRREVRSESRTASRRAASGAAPTPVSDPNKPITKW